jgi:aminoglycoside/choline kinase family phosphotransferase
MDKMQRLSRYTRIAAFAVCEWSSMDVADASDSRLSDLTQWVRDDLGFADSVIAPASADASFRRYFRVIRDADSYIVMDAPPAKEDVIPFLKVQRILAAMDLNVPAVLARDVPRGFLLLSDLGSRPYLDELRSKEDAKRLYKDALAALLTMQGARADACRDLPRYSADALLKEMQLMPEWFLERHLGLSLAADERLMLEELFAVLIQAAAAQPAVFVHRDYHSRNLLFTAADNPGILDFQDAVWGPVTYDLVSLLKDCYIAWPPADVREWALGYREQLLGVGIDAGDASEFLRGFDLMGLQRHIKVLGIFARLNYRDGKAQYLNDLPRVLDYTLKAAAAYADTAPFADFIARRVEPEFGGAQQRALA